MHLISHNKYQIHIKHLQKSVAFFLSGCVKMNGLQNHFKTLALIPTITSLDLTNIRIDNCVVA